MTTYTKVSDSDKPLIEIDAGKKLSKVDPMTYGGFIEYVVSMMGCSTIRRVVVQHPPHFGGPI